jgi:hypothetical protein
VGKLNVYVFTTGRSNFLNTKRKETDKIGKKIFLLDKKLFIVYHNNYWLTRKNPLFIQRVFAIDTKHRLTYSLWGLPL